MENESGKVHKNEIQKSSVAMGFIVLQIHLLNDSLNRVHFYGKLFCKILCLLVFRTIIGLLSENRKT